MSSHVKHIILIIVLLVVLGLVGFAVSENSANQAGTVSSEKVVIEESIAPLPLDERKNEVLARVSDPNRILTESEKGVLIEVLSGKAFIDYGFTAEEQQMIIEALNR